MSSGVIGKKVLVTGASGVLGSAVVSALGAAGVQARGTGRHPQPLGLRGEWRQADLLSGVGLISALEDISCVVHCASSGRRPREDLVALDRLLTTARSNRPNIVYVGIAGIEDAAAVFDYYAVKLACEAKLAQSGLPFTIARATQFHTFVDMILQRLTLGPFLFTPRLTLQPVDVSFVADRLAALSIGPPRGRVNDLHGPERLDTKALTSTWRRAHPWKVSVPAPNVGPLAALARLRRVEGDAGGRTWSDWIGAQMLVNAQ